MTFSDQDEIKNILKELKSDVRNVSEKVIELSIINKNHENTSSANSSKIEVIESEIHFAKGSIALFKAVGLTIAGASCIFCITFGTWVVTSNQNTQSNIAEVRKDIALIDHDVKSIKAEIADEQFKPQ